MRSATIKVTITDKETGVQFGYGVDNDNFRDHPEKIPRALDHVVRLSIDAFGQVMQRETKQLLTPSHL